MIKYIKVFAFFLIAVLACACSWEGEADASPGMGMLSISWGNSASSLFVQGQEMLGFVYTVQLSGTNGYMVQSFAGVPSANFTLLPGTWTVKIKGYSGNTLKVMGIEEYVVIPGINPPKVMPMYTATEIDNWGDLRDQIENSNNANDFNPAAPREEIIVLKKNWRTVNGAISANFQINIVRPIILIAESSVTIERNTAFPFFYLMNGSNSYGTSVGRLTLGKKGMGGSITLDGASSSGSETVVSLFSFPGFTAQLVINSNLSIQNNNNITSGSGGVNVGDYSQFIMNGGTISGNSTIDNGGGVCVEHGGTFIMNGGTISRNDASAGKGGGVYVYDGGSFTKNGSGGVIYGSSQDPNSNSSALGGPAVYYNRISIPLFRNDNVGSFEKLSTNSESGWSQ